MNAIKFTHPCCTALGMFQLHWLVNWYTQLFFTTKIDWLINESDSVN